MGAVQPGVVVLVRFPFSDLSASKLRPAAVLARAGGVDWVLCQVTSNPYGDPGAVPLTSVSFASGGLGRDSFARPGKLFTASESLVVRVVGQLTGTSHRELVDASSPYSNPESGEAVEQIGVYPQPHASDGEPSE